MPDGLEARPVARRARPPAPDLRGRDRRVPRRLQRPRAHGGRLRLFLAEPGLDLALWSSPSTASRSPAVSVAGSGSATTASGKAGSIPCSPGGVAATRAGPRAHRADPGPPARPGRERAALGVDLQSPNQTLPLYESCGFRLAARPRAGASRWSSMSPRRTHPGRPRHRCRPLPERPDDRARGARLDAGARRGVRRAPRRRSPPGSGDGRAPARLHGPDGRRRRHGRRLRTLPVRDPRPGRLPGRRGLGGHRRRPRHGDDPRPAAATQAFTRLVAGRRSDGQVVAANVDVILIAMGLDGDFNLRRLERYLAVGWTSGAMPVVILTKADRCPDIEGHVLAVTAVAPGVPVLAISALTGLRDGGARRAPAARPDGGHPGKLGRRQVDARERAPRHGCARHGRGPRRRPRPAHDDLPAARVPARRGEHRRHARHARARPGGRRRGLRRRLRGHRRDRRRVPVLGLPPRSRAGLRGRRRDRRRPPDAGSPRRLAQARARGGERTRRVGRPARARRPAASDGCTATPR